MNLMTTTRRLTIPEHPSQGIDDILRAGFDNFIIDGSMYLEPDVLMRWDKKLNDEWIRKDISVMKAELQKRGVVPGAVILPYASFEMLRSDYVDVLIKYSRLVLHEFEQIGVSKFIVRPIVVNIARDNVRELNEKFYLDLVQSCENVDTQILLVNSCRSVGGHLVRGMFTEPDEAVEWVDSLNNQVDGAKSIDKCGDRRFAFCADIGAYNLCAMNMQDTLKSISKITEMIILGDNNGQTNMSLMPFFGENGGYGAVDYLSIIRGLREIRFDKDLVIDASTSVELCPAMLRSKYLAFLNDVAEYIKWQIELETSLYKYKNIVLFGAGNMCRAFMKAYGDRVHPLFTCDNNPKSWGTEFEGLEVKNPESLRELPDNTGVYICNMYYREIEAQLREMGIVNIEFFNDEYLPSYHENRIDRDKKQITN